MQSRLANLLVTFSSWSDFAHLYFAPLLILLLTSQWEILFPPFPSAREVKPYAFLTTNKKHTETFILILGMTCTQSHMKKLGCISTLCSSFIKLYGILLESYSLSLSFLSYGNNFFKINNDPSQQLYLFNLLPVCSMRACVVLILSLGLWGIKVTELYW